MTYIPRLKTKYKEEIRTALKEKFQYKSVMQVPKLEKIAINQGVGGATTDKKLIENTITELTTITGQQAVSSKSKKDISNFKLRKNMPVGVRVTLRDNTMYEFLDRLIAVALPRIRDFKGINDKGFDGRGNYTLGITEQIIFPEINIDKINKIQGMDITFVTSATNDVEALELLKQFGLPFKNQTPITMAKEGVKAREVKRAKLVAKFAEKRAALKAAGDYIGLDKLPKASSPVKLHNRCKLTGRPRGYMRQFGISRVTFRDMALAGKIPGVKKQAGN
jgi:large subunit ribosomal protein L5